MDYGFGVAVAYRRALLGDSDKSLTWLLPSLQRIGEASITDLLFPIQLWLGHARRCKVALE